MDCDVLEVLELHCHEGKGQPASGDWSGLQWTRPRPDGQAPVRGA